MFVGDFLSGFLYGLCSLLPVSWPLVWMFVGDFLSDFRYGLCSLLPVCWPLIWTYVCLWLTFCHVFCIVYVHRCLFVGPLVWLYDDFSLFIGLLYGCMPVDVCLSDFLYGYWLVCVCLLGLL